MSDTEFVATRSQHTSGRAIKRLAVISAALVMLFAVVLIDPASAQASSARAGSAGTDIGNAAQLTGTTSGSLATSLSDNWWVITPARVGGGVTVKADNTSPSSSPGCDVLTVEVYGTDGVGQPEGGANLTPDTSQVFSDVSSPGSDRTFVEVETDGCNPQSGQPLTYTLDLESGGGGTPPSPTAGAIAAGASIGTAWPPLPGSTSTTGKTTSGAAEEWYSLYENVSTEPATIRVENTTVKGSTTCSSPYLTVDLFGSDGVGQPDNGANLADNGATVFQVPSTGVPDTLLFLEISDPGCPGGGETYRIEPEGAGQFGNPAKVRAGSVAAAGSIGGAWPPLQGDESVSGKLTSGADQAWYSLYENANVAATVRVEDTTVDGSTTCTSGYIAADLYGEDGVAQPDNGATLAHNGAVTFQVPTSGLTDQLFYLEITDPGCPAGGEAYRITPEPSRAWALPPEVPTETMPVGSSLANAGGPLSGGVIYQASLPGAPIWAEFVSDGVTPVTVTVADVSTYQEECQGSIDVDVETTAGQPVDGANLADDGAARFQFSSHKVYALEISNESECDPGDQSKVDVGFTPSDASTAPNEITAYNFFISKGLTPVQAAGLVGNLQQESGVNPTQKQVHGPAMGIAQWEAPRWKQLKAYEGKRYLTLAGQLDFVWHELSTGYYHKLADGPLKACTTVACATTVVMDKYEQANSDLNHYTVRLAFANAIHTLCTKTKCAGL